MELSTALVKLLGWLKITRGGFMSDSHLLAGLGKATIAIAVAERWDQLPLMP
jgi:hypothetical protein